MSNHRDRVFSARTVVVALIAAIFVGFGLGSTARAVPEAGSVLFFPLYDSAPGSGTVIAVTNTFTSRRACSDNRLEGDVRLHYTYFNGETCREFDRYEYLTPGDTFTVLADEHNPEGDRGYLIVIAQSPVGGLLNFNHLIGQAILVQAGLDVAWSYNAFAVKALAGDASNGCDRANPDDGANGGDDDFRADFNGIEYEMLTAEVALPTFFEESDRFDNMLALMSTAGDYRVETTVLMYNNVEDVYSRSFDFECWWAGSLSEITLAARNLGGDPEETGHNTETGWVSIRGRRVRDGNGNIVNDRETGEPIVPALVGVFMQRILGTDFASGDFLYGRGDKIDGLDLP
jgi:hypothetical protein